MVRLSFATTCMRRLAHLQETLPSNMSAVAEFSDYVDFHLLNYDCDPEFREWAVANASLLGIGRIVHYYELIDPRVQYFDRSHAKNVIHRLASGDYVCNLDADNFLSEHFVSVVLSLGREPNTFFTVADLHMKGIWGRIAVPRWAFAQVGGYDESYVGWGHEDVDLIDRLRRHGLNQVKIECPDTAIEHTDEVREVNHPVPMARSRVENKEIGYAHQASGIVVVNETGWGRGTVEKNFAELISLT